MELDQALQTFIVEAHDLQQEMEAILLSIENHPNDVDAINALFRAAHTIKGSAGLFALDELVAFTHVVESVLDRVRDGELAIDGDLVALLLASSDHIGLLVEHVTRNVGTMTETDRLKETELLVSLNGYLGAPLPLQVSEPAAGQDEVHKETTGDSAENDNWHLSLRFGQDLLRNGMDPASFIRYLGTLGQIIRIIPMFDAMPPAAEMDPESCYMGLEIALRSEASKEAIEGVFDFVREESTIRILPPNSKVTDYLALIEELPSEHRLGEILVRIGALTQRELEEGLSLQQKSSSNQPLGEILVDQHSIQQPVVEAALKKQEHLRDTKQDTKAVRVDADKLDHLINLVGELVIASAGASLLANRTAGSELHEATSVITRLVEEVRDSALKLRMVQIGSTFNRFQRVVRDVSRELSKDIDLVINGAETELDKTVVEKIGDPLTHLVRNAMDHGIERADARQAKGKPPKGTLKLNAYHDSGSIVIEVSDDGDGLDRDKILEKARERGLVAPDQAISGNEIDHLIFEPGFSTASQVTNLSGRGVGMDVVKRAITALRGTIELDSHKGVGTTFRVRLPLTLAIIDGFQVRVGRSSFVIPLDMVLESVELSENDRKESKDHHYVNLRGEVLPFIRLRELFKIEDRPGQRENVVVVQSGAHKAGLVVDELLGELQTVIKPLGKIFAHLKGIGGSTILGTGEVALILDVPALIQKTMAQETFQTSPS